MEESIQQQEKSKEEILAARREARRKRILDNSTNRLSKIVGHELPSTPPNDRDDSMVNEDNLSGDILPANDEAGSEPSYIIYPDPPDERMEYIHPQVDALLANSGIDDDSSFMNGGRNSDIFQLLNTLGQAQSNGGVFAGTASSNPSANNQPASNRENSQLARFLHTKLHLVIASIVSYLLIATGNEKYIGGNVFLPLLAWELLEILTFGVAEAAGAQHLLSVVFLLGGIPMKTSQTIMKIMNTINKVLKDVAFFMFFFVLSHLLWSRLWLGIELRYVLGYDQLEPADGVVDTFTSSDFLPS